MHNSSGLYTLCLWIRDKCDNKHTTSVWRQIFISRVEQKRAWINISTEWWADDGNGGGGDDDNVAKHYDTHPCYHVYLFTWVLSFCFRRLKNILAPNAALVPNICVRLKWNTQSVALLLGWAGRKMESQTVCVRERERAGWKIPFRFKINESSLHYVC